MTDATPPDLRRRIAGTALPASYPDLLAGIQKRIRTARTRAALSVNAELVRLYWDIGEAIVQRQSVEGWGAAVIEQLSADLMGAFPGLRGFSQANLWRMRSFYSAYSLEDTNLAQAVRELGNTRPPSEVMGIPWGHNVVLVERLADSEERLWYARQTLEYGWSRAVLVHQIGTGLYHRQGRAITNFENTLPPPDSDLAKRLIKDPYAFDFLDVGTELAERKLETKLIDRVRDMLLELGRGFAFVGSQYRLEVGGEEFFIDLVRKRLPSPEQLVAGLLGED